MKLAEIIFNIIWLLLGVAIMIFMVFTIIQENAVDMITTFALLVVYIIDTTIWWG